MKTIISSLIVVVLVMVGSWAMAMTDGGGMMGDEGMMAGFHWGWIVYRILIAAAVVIGLWLFYRITKAVERIAAKP